MKACAVGTARLFMTSSLIVSVITSLLCGMARGDDRSAGKLFRLRAAAFVTIGSVYSLGEVSINGRRVYGQEMIWGGDVLQVFEEATARVLIDSVGNVALTQGTTVRLAVSTSSLEDGTESFVLLVSLIGGVATVTLLEKGSAFLQAGESAFFATKGSSFRAEITAGRPVIDVLRGKVDVESSPPTRDYEVEMYKYDSAKKAPTGSPLPANTPIEKKSGNKSKLAARSFYTDDGRAEVNATSNIIRVGSRPSVQVGQPASGQNAGANRTISFGLDNRDVGTLVSDSGRGQIVTGRTNAQGYAFVTFEAGSNGGSATFTVSDVTFEQTPRERRHDWHTLITVKKLGFFEKGRNRAILGAAAAAVITIVFRHRSKPLRQEPPPQIP
jgi:hypothetical protein